jgi:DNA replication factor GINS
VHLDELRSVLLSERETGRLIHLVPDLYESTLEELGQISKEVYSQEDPFSDRTRILIERVGSIRETLCDIFRIRAEKIVALAQTQQEGGYIDRDEIKKMLPAEREMFDQISMAMEQCRCRLVAGQHPPLSEVEEERGVHPVEVCEPCPVTEPPAPAYVLARVLADMEPFMGVDGRIYHLQKEDIVTLPRRNAEVLCERNIVLNIQM